MSQPEDVSVSLRHNPMFAQDAEGNPITRERTCECGKTFSQRLLSQRFFNIVARRGAKCLAEFERQIPEGFVPVFCPACERKDIGRRATVDNHRLEFHEPAEAAD